MAIPMKYDPLLKVVPSDRVPHIPVEILYLIAKALPQPSQVFNLARVNKTTWEYLQPALYECEVTYEARLVAHFGDGYKTTRPSPNVEATGRVNQSGGNHVDADNDGQSRQCAHGLATALCEVCGQRIAIKEKYFGTILTYTARERFGENINTLHDFFQSRGIPALHWACRRGIKAMSVARKAIEAAKAHQPSYIDGRGLRLRRFDTSNQTPFGPQTLVGEIPPPLFTAAAFGNTKLCEALVEAGCNVNLLLSMDYPYKGANRPPLQSPFFLIHERCVYSLNDPKICRWQHIGAELSSCQTAGHVALNYGRSDAVVYLLDRGLDPLVGQEPLIHRAAGTCDLPAVKTLLDRFPEMASHRWRGLTPLHTLCMQTRDTMQMEAHPLEKMKSVAAYLVQKGADLEAEIDENPRIPPRFTPLEYALRDSNWFRSDKLHAPMALMTLGAVWNRPLSSMSPTETILNHCVREAALPHSNDAGKIRRLTYLKETWIKRSLEYAKLVKTMVRNTPPPITDLVPAQGSEPPMQAFLGAFKFLAVESREKMFGTDIDLFAVEAVGKLLLSTGITPDHDDLKKWKFVVANNLGRDETTKRLWRDLTIDVPENVGGD